ncbi:beta-1,3-galactosyl-O-glycosyl-glycoprotein beta-1,6-N-acetylglucosaminyltransferase-like [Glandiceps talaboti]
MTPQSHKWETSISGIRCSDLINGRLRTQDIVSEKMDALIQHMVSGNDSDFNEVSECATFLQSRGYLDKPVTQEEVEFPLAFSIVMHKSVHQVEQLLRTIYRPHNVYCIHVDKKSPLQLHTAMHAIASCFDNVFIASRLVKVTWGSISQVYAERSCQKDLLTKNQKWKYLINLTGQEFPLKTNLEIVQILKLFKGQNDIVTLAKVFPGRTAFRHYENSNWLVRSSVKKTEPLPGNIVIHKGGVQSALTRPFVEFLHESVIAQEFLIWLNDTESPDEAFYQSLASLPEAPGGPGVDGSHDAVSRLIVWQKTSSCKGKFVREVCVFSWRDLPWIVQQPHLFVNKFHRESDSITLHCLEELINNRTSEPSEITLNLYQHFEKVRSWDVVNSESQRWQVYTKKILIIIVLIVLVFTYIYFVYYCIKHTLLDAEKKTVDNKEYRYREGSLDIENQF